MTQLKKKLVLPYIVLVLILYVVIFIYLATNYFIPFAWNEIIFFFVIFFIVSNYTFLKTGFKMSISFKIPLLFVMALKFGPFWATLITVIAGTSLNSFKKFDFTSFIFNHSMVGIISGLSSLYLYQFFNADSTLSISSFIIAGLIYSIANLILLTLIIYFDSEDGLSSINFVYFWELVRGVGVSIIIGFILYNVYHQYGNLSLIIFLAGLLLLKNLLLTFYNQHNSFFHVINSFMKVIDAKDHYTTAHCDRVAKYTEDLAKICGFSRFGITKLVQIARLHDVGKIWIPDYILNKPSKLEPEEYEIVKTHTVRGMELLSEIKIFANYLPVIRHHHERYDGTGYPDGLKEIEIPIEARLLAVTDAFDVMTHGRIYKPPMGKEEVIHELEICAGKQFDPEIVTKLLELIYEGKYDHLFVNQIS